MKKLYPFALLGILAYSSLTLGCTQSSNTVEFPDDPAPMPVEDDESSEQNIESEQD